MSSICHKFDIVFFSRNWWCRRRRSVYLWVFLSVPCYPLVNNAVCQHEVCARYNWDNWMNSSHVLLNQTVQLIFLGVIHEKRPHCLSSRLKDLTSFVLLSAQSALITPYSKVKNFRSMSVPQHVGTMVADWPSLNPNMTICAHLKRQISRIRQESGQAWWSTKTVLWTRTGTNCWKTLLTTWQRDLTRRQYGQWMAIRQVLSTLTMRCMFCQGETSRKTLAVACVGKVK